MKYRANQPKNDYAKALYLSKETERRLLNAIQKIFDEIGADKTSKDFSIDEVNERIAPYIKTPEEAYFCAQNIVASVISAQQEYKSFFN